LGIIFCERSFVSWQNISLDTLEIHFLFLRKNFVKVLIPIAGATTNRPAEGDRNIALLVSANVKAFGKAILESRVTILCKYKG
jgi:hypothetical protein